MEVQEIGSNHFEVRSRKRRCPWAHESERIVKNHVSDRDKESKSEQKMKAVHQKTLYMLFSGAKKSEEESRAPTPSCVSCVRLQSGIVFNLCQSCRGSTCSSCLSSCLGCDVRICGNCSVEANLQERVCLSCRMT